MATKKTTKSISDDIKDVAKELDELSTTPVVEIEEVVKTSAKKAVSKAKTAATKTKTAASSTAKKASTVAKKTAEKVSTAASTVTAKKEIKRTAVVEYAGNQYMVDDVIARCEAKFKAENKKKAYKDIKVYIKPENNAAYYVVDEKSADKIDLI